MTENNIQKQIMEYLKFARQKDVPVVWRQNTGALVIKGKSKDRFVRFGEKGISDILGILRGGRMLAIEVKTPARRKQVSIWQKDFIDRINNAGGLAFVATSIEEVEQQLNKIRRNKNG